MKQEIKKIASKMKPLFEGLASIESKLSRSWASSAHRRLFNAQWKLLPEPEFFNHHIDLYWSWQQSGNSLWVERGVFGSLTIKAGGKILELCCGDGFNSKHFYAHRAKSVIAVDFDPKAIHLAGSINYASNIEFKIADIRTQMPEGSFDNVVWDAAIEHFTPQEISNILKAIKNRLGSDGILSGYTNAECEDGNKALSHHEYEFKDKQELLDLLKPHFKNVWVFETVYPSRRNLYFWASEGVIPFSKNWNGGCSQLPNG